MPIPRMVRHVRSLVRRVCRIAMVRQTPGQGLQAALADLPTAGAQMARTPGLQTG